MKEGIAISEPPSTLKVFTSCYWAREVFEKLFFVIQKSLNIRWFFPKKFCMNYDNTISKIIIQLVHTYTQKKLPLKYGRVKQLLPLQSHL